MNAVGRLRAGLRKMVDLPANLPAWHNPANCFTGVRQKLIKLSRRAGKPLDITYYVAFTQQNRQYEGNGVIPVSQDTLPLVTIITPSFNQGKFIRETIQSVLNQDYPNIEHIVVDGGSTDETLAILQEYSQLGERFRFVSEPDRGQSHAVNKGLAMARGEIIGWLNSDDTYQPGAVTKAVRMLRLHPEWAMVYGRAFTIDETGQIRNACEYVQPADFLKLFRGCFICQPASFIRKSVFQQVGGLDESLSFCMDYDLWIRIAKAHPIGFIADYLANSRSHKDCKTETIWTTVGIPEIVKTCIKHYGRVSDTWKTLYLQTHSAQSFARLVKETSRLYVWDVPSRPARIISMNGYKGDWVPLHFRIIVESNAFVKKLLVRGKIPLSHVHRARQANKYQCSVLVNKQWVGNFPVAVPSFQLEIPLDGKTGINEIDIHSSWFILAGHDRTKLLSFIAEDVVPLSS